MSRQQDDLGSASDWHRLFSGIPDEGSAAFEAFCRFCEAHRSHTLAALPWLAAEVAGTDGFTVLFRLIRTHGGARLYVPVDYARFQRRQGAGISAATHARLLKQANAAGSVEVPSAWGVFLALRRVAVQAALDAGATPRAVARGFGVSERSLRRGRQPERSMRNLSA